MPACEKCWADAYRRAMNDPSRTQFQHYSDLLKEREDTPCSPKDQAGEWWDEERQIDRRLEKKEEAYG